MQGLFRRAVASVAALVLLAPTAGDVSFASSSHRSVAKVTVALASPPQRIPVKEPVRVKPSPFSLSGLRPKTVPGVRAHGIPVAGPPMFRPLELDHAMAAMRRRAMQQRSSEPNAPRGAPPSRSMPLPAPAGTRPGTRRAMSLPSDPTASGTGINHWWRYQEENVPGGGHLMVNVGTGNLLLQDDDMMVPHKGIAMAFRRTYNSQSPTTVSGDLQTWTGLYGNGWTNTFDAHVIRTSPGHFSVYDIDGARYDFVPSGTPGLVIGPPGQPTTLQWDGACGLLWQKKSGTLYYFYDVNSAKPCSTTTGTVGGYAGRIHQIIGRNRNTSITFNYSWDNGDASASGKISQITATTESGMTATLSFADFNGHRLLQQLTYPDNATTVQYGYDAGGNLTSISRPPNNAAGVRPTQLLSYQQVGNDSVLFGTGSPREAVACGTSGGCTSDGGGLLVGFTGSSAATSLVSSIQARAVVNPVIPDGTNAGALQGASYPTVHFPYYTEYYTTGVTTPTFRDTDGHMTNWVVDGTGRPTQTQECTASTNQGQQCTGTWLLTNESWDANNNLTSEIDPRGNETDYAYDANGNTIAVAEPQMTVAQGTFRPTALYSYDSFNNLTAYCDPNATHTLSSDWVSAPSGDGLCPITSPLSTRFVWSTDPAQSGTASANPAYEPYGELIAKIEPGTAAVSNGYRVNYSYDSSRQGGADYGLPTAVTASAPFSQADGTERQPTQSFWYDAHGRLGCYDKGSGAWVLAYDALGRLVSAADPDDNAAGGGICGKTGGMSGWSTAMTTTYFPDGSVATKQSASQRAAGVSTTFTYDLDGNESSETHHYGCTSVSSCTAGVTQKWYDGAERLVEVALPYDGYDVQGYPMMTRYIYDLSQGQTTPYQSLGLRGYGNLVKTQDLLSGTVITPFTSATYSSFTPYPLSSGVWTDVRATSFDALDRALSSYEAAFASQPKLANTYDGPPPAGGPAQLGLLSSTTLATNEVKQYAYDVLGRATDSAYSNDGGATSPVHVRYDASGHVTSRGTDVLGNETLQYDNAGEVTSVAEPASLGSVAITYDYYPDGARKDLGFASTAFSATPLYQYSYRSDGRRSSLKLNNGSAFGWSYTQAGRLQSQTDPLTGKSISPDNYYTLGKSATQHPYYPTSVTFVPETYSYDNYGRTTGVALPAGVFSQSVSGFDLEDGVAGTSGLSVQAPTNVTTGTCNTSNVRNEKVPIYKGSCYGYFYNGAVFAPQVSAVGDNQWQDGAAPAPWTLDARAGMLKSWQGVSETSGNTSSGQFSYDASGRVIADTEQLDRAWRPSDGSMPGNRVYSTGTRTKTYDAENRLRSQQTSPAQGATYPLWGENNPGGYWNDVSQGSAYELQAVDYSASSHPVRFAAPMTPDFGVSLPSYTLFWLWDGDNVLAQCGYDNSHSQCSAYEFSVEGLGNYYPGNGYISVQDRGISGQIVASHDAMSFSGMKPVGRNSRNYFYGGYNATGAPGSASPDTAGGLPAGNAIMTGTKVALDGWTFDNNTWQGVRTYDTSVGQWTTPDAYAGDVHDPMSQKPFMWNRNNPYAYSDPSGYEIGNIWRGWEGDNTPSTNRTALDWLVEQIFDAAGMALAAEVPLFRGTGGAVRSAVRLGSERSVERLTIHVVERHLVGGALTSGRGIFSKGTSVGDVARMIKAAVANSKPIQQGAEMKFEYNVGHVIGVDKSGNPSSTIRAAFDRNGDLKSAYPI